MDGAADKVNKLVAGILPNQPHHLSISATQRYPASTGFWQHNSPLQYTTYVAAGDRGVLLTRPSYDIHEEAEPDVVPATRSDSKKPVIKMSFKDYRESKHRKLSESPPDSGPATTMEVRPTHELHGGGQKLKLNGDNRSRNPQSKPPPPEPRGQSPTAQNKKRVADTEDSARPQKRAKSDSFGKLDPDRPSPLGRSINSKDSPSQGPVNGRNQQREPVVNGTRSSQVENGYAASHRSDSAARDLVPPLLSPLRLSLDDESPRRRPPDNGGGGGGGGGGLLKPAIKLSKADVVVSRSRQRSPLRLPPLLSPTLPQVVEDELQRLRNTPVKGSGDSSQVSDSPSSAKKARTTNADAPEDEHRPSARPSLIVTLKYKKKNAKRVMRLLALQPISDRKERSLSIEGTPPPPRKRPLAEAPATTSSPSSKRPAVLAEKTISARPMQQPSTPLKTTAMSRAASSNSQPAQTPGDSSGAGLTPGASERPSTSQGEQPNASAAALYHRSDRYSKLGTRLKHDRDAIIKSRGSNGTTANQPSTGQKKLVAVLSLEMVMSYMIAFKSLNQARQMDRKPAEFRSWEGLMPHLMELRSHTRHFRPLEGLALQLYAVCLEQLVQALTTHNNSNTEAVGKLFSASRKRADAWMDAHHCIEAVGDGSMRVTVGPWSSTEDVVRSVLPVIRRWTEREQVDDWKPSVSPPRVTS